MIIVDYAIKLALLLRFV